MKSRPLVLVIDDSEDAREVYATVLRLDGFAVEEAIDGQQGLEKARRSLPDVIITDLEMPVMDGWETIRRLKADQRTRTIPIIACSGATIPRPEKRVFEPTEPTYDAHLVKPCLPDVLLSEIRGFVRRAA